MSENVIDFEECEESTPWNGGYVRMDEKVVNGMCMKKEYDD